MSRFYVAGTTPRVEQVLVSGSVRRHRIRMHQVQQRRPGLEAGTRRSTQEPRAQRHVIAIAVYLQRSSRRQCGVMGISLLRHARKVEGSERVEGS